MHGKLGLLSPGIASSHSTALPRFFVFSCVQCFRVSVIHRTLTWTTGSLTCVRSYACVCTRGWCTPTASQHNINFWLGKTLTIFFLCSGRDSNLWTWNPLDFEADALPIEPPRPHVRHVNHTMSGTNFKKSLVLVGVDVVVVSLSLSFSLSLSLSLALSQTLFWTFLLYCVHCH